MMKRLLFSILAMIICCDVFAQSISSNSPLCTDSATNLELKASGGSTYVWSGPNNFTSNQQNPVIVRPTSSNSGTYTCLIDGKTTLNTSVRIGKSISPIEAYSYILGASIALQTYSPSNANTSSFTYSWSGPNNFKAEGRSAFVNGYDRTAQGNYTVTAKDEFGCTTSKIIPVNVLDCSYQQVITARSKSGNRSSWSGNNSVTICESLPTIFEVDTTYWGSGLTFQWFKDGKAIENATTMQLPVSEEGNYTVRVVKGNCSYQTTKLDIKLGSINSSIVRDFVNGNYILDKEICSKGGSTVLISRYSDGSSFIDGQVTRQWYKDGVALQTSSNNQSTYTATEAGKYQVKIKTGQCEALSDPVAVRTVEKIKPQYYFTVGGSQLVGQSTVKLCNEYSGSVEITGSIAVSGSKKIYQNGIVISDLSASQLGFSRVVTKQPGTYVLETIQGQCKSSDTLRLDYGKTTDVPVRKVDYISCNNPTFYYTINPQVTLDNSITWTKDGVLVSSVNTVLPSGSGIYQAKYENVATGCKGESEKIKVVVSSTLASDYIKIVSHPTKKVTICKNSANAKILSLNQFFATGGTWKRDGKVHDAGSGYYQTKITQGGKYWYEYNNGQCITYSDTIEAVEEELPKITLTQTCLKDNTVKLNVNSVAGAKYNWFQNGGVMAGKDTTITVSQLGKYTVEVFRNECYVAANELSIGVSVPEITNICSGDSLKLKALSDGSATYNWTGPNNFKSNAQNPSIEKATRNNQGFYRLSATDKGGCTFVAQTQVIVNDYPAFTLPKTVTACAGTEFVFNQFVAKPLTDSTETVGSYSFTAPNKNIYYGFSSFSNISSRDAGNYDVTVTGSVGGCVVKTSMEIVVDASANCKSINVVNYNNSRVVCVEQTAEIPFTTTGTFKAGTDFRAYYEENYLTNDGFKTRKIILGTSTQSPIKMSGFKSGSNYFVKVESDDGISSLRGQYLYTSSANSNSIVDANGSNRSAECTSLPLTLGSNALYANPQWFFNGDTLRKETTRSIIASKTGTYTFKAKDSNGCNVSFSKDIVIGKLDKPVVSSNGNELNCFNESIYVGANQYYNNVKYTWRRDGILQTDNSNFIQATIAGKYVLEVSKETCKVNSDTIMIKQNTEKNSNLTVYTYAGRDSNNEPQTLIYMNGLGSATYKFQLFKDNQLFAEGRESGIAIKDAGKYFFKVVKGDCEGLSDVIDFKGVNPISTSPKTLSFSGNYDYTSNVIQLCDTSTVMSMNGYFDYLVTNVVRRVVTAYKDDKPLPAFNENSRVYPSLRFTPIDNYFNIYFRSPGTYYAIEEVTFKDSTKLKFRYNEMKVVLSPSFNLGVKTPQNIFACGDSVIVYGNTYNNNNQRAVSFTWKKDGVVFKKTTNQNDAGYLIVKQSGTYVLETTNKGGCVGIATPQKVELGKIGIQLDTMSRTLCDGTTVMLNSRNFSGLVSDVNGVITGVSYQWQKDGKDYTPVVNVGLQDVYRNINLSTKEAGVYTLKGQQGKCQGISASVVVKALKVPNTINYADSVLFCQTQSVSLKTTEDATLSYLWERDGGFIKDATKATLDIKEAGIYRSLNRKASCWNYTPKVRAKVLANVLPTAIITGNKEINYADTAKVSIAFTSHAPWTFKLSDGKEYTTTKSPFEVSLKPQFSTDYTLTEVKNVCGTGTVSGTANIKVLILSSEPEAGVNLNVFPVPSMEDVTIQVVTDKPETMEWTLTNVSGSTLQQENLPQKSTKHESNVSLKAVPVGTYFLRIQVGEKSLVRKVVKGN
jgi:Secretion system C-terminal sorting domain